MKNNEIQNENHKNHENQIILRGSYEILENLRSPHENHENHENLRISIR